MVRIVVTLGILASATWVAVRTDLLGSLVAVRDLDPTMLAVAALATLAAVLNRGLLHHQSRSLHGVECSLGTEIRMSAASLALNKVVKSGGLAGLAYYLRRGRRDGASATAVTRAFVVVGAAAHVALAGLAVATLTVVPRDDVPVAGALSDMVVGTVGLVAFVMVAGVFLAGVLTSGSGHGAGRLAAGAAQIVLHAGVNKLLGVFTLAAVLAAASAPVSIETAVVVYATALVGGALSFVPGGVGVVEASMVAVLTASGVEPGAALVAVLTFRLFDLWIPVLVGWGLARGLEATTEIEPLVDASGDVVLPIALGAGDGAVPAVAPVARTS